MKWHITTVKRKTNRYISLLRHTNILNKILIVITAHFAFSLNVFSYHFKYLSVNPSKYRVQRIIHIYCIHVARDYVSNRLG